MAMSRRRLAARRYAQQYLGVKRLPPGVPRLLDEMARGPRNEPPPYRAIASVLDRYRKVPFLP